MTEDLQSLRRIISRDHCQRGFVYLRGKRPKWYGRYHSYSISGGVQVRRCINTPLGELATMARGQAEAELEGRINAGKLSHAAERALMLFTGRLYGHSTERTYFVRCQDYCKIGFCQAKPGRRAAGGANSRISAFQTGNPYDLELLFDLSGGKALEEQFHDIFQNLRHRNEWFRVQGELKEFLDIAVQFLPSATFREQEATVNA